MYQISKGNCTVEKDLPPSLDDSSDDEGDSDDDESPGVRRQVVNRLKDGGILFILCFTSLFYIYIISLYSF